MFLNLLDLWFKLCFKFIFNGVDSSEGDFSGNVVKFFKSFKIVLKSIKIVIGFEIWNLN